MNKSLQMIENPAAFQSPTTRWDLKQAEAYCAKLAKTHYENFTVGSFFVPRKLRQHMYNVYAYCRWSDDLGDEVKNPRLSLQLLEDWEKQLEACYQGDAKHPVFVALRKTIETFGIPKTPFWRLLQAFKQDQMKNRYATFEELLGYCVNSANPVGHLVLYLFGYRDKELQNLSDKTCTALQLANFWQDVARDLKIGRIYVPREDWKRFEVSEEDFSRPHATPAFKKMMAFEVDRTRALFSEGLPLVDRVKGLLRVDLEAFSRGGLAVLRGIEKIDYDVLARRPVVGRVEKLGILLQAVRRLFF